MRRNLLRELNERKGYPVIVGIPTPECKAEREYRAEVIVTPNYPAGGKRPEWYELPEIARWQRVKIARIELQEVSMVAG